MVAAARVRQVHGACEGDTTRRGRGYPVELVGRLGVAVGAQELGAMRVARARGDEAAWPMPAELLLLPLRALGCQRGVQHDQVPARVEF